MWDWREAFTKLKGIVDDVVSPQRVASLRAAIGEIVHRGGSSSEISEALEALRLAETGADAEQVIADAWRRFGPSVESASSTSITPAQVPTTQVSVRQSSLRMVSPQPNLVVGSMRRPRLFMPTSDWCRDVWEAAYATGVMSGTVARSSMDKALENRFTDTQMYIRAKKFIGSGFRQGVWFALASGQRWPTYRLVKNPPPRMIEMLSVLTRITRDRPERSFTYDELRSAVPSDSQIIDWNDMSETLSWMAAFGIVARRARGSYVLNVAPYEPWPWSMEETEMAMRRRNGVDVAARLSSNQSGMRVAQQ